MKNKLEKLGELYNELGNEILSQLRPKDRRILLYAKAGPGFASVSIYEDSVNKVQYVRYSDQIADIVMDLWATEEPDKRWVEMQLDIEGTQFTARNFFADQLNPHEDDDIRRERAVRERFGDKPIDYGVTDGD